MDRFVLYTIQGLMVVYTPDMSGNKVNIVLICPWTMLWVLIRRTSPKRFLWVHIICFLEHIRNMFEIIWQYLVGTNRGVACMKDNSCSVLFLVVFPKWIAKPNSCALHNFLMVWNILIIFDISINKDQKGCVVQGGQLSLSLLCTYLPWNPNLV